MNQPNPTITGLLNLELNLDKEECGITEGLILFGTNTACSKH